MATEGDTVWVIVYHVKPDKKEQFERLIYDILWPASQNLDESAQRAFHNTRVLNPAAQNEDGTYSYVLLMDPVIAGEDYSIRSILSKMYPEEEAEQHFKVFEESITDEYEQYTVLQSKYWGNSSMN